MNDLQELSTFSHEINNSLTLIYGQIQCIEKTYDTLTRNDHWNRMKDDFSSLFDFIHQFLAPAEESSAAMEPLDLISVISEIRSYGLIISIKNRFASLFRQTPEPLFTFTVQDQNFFSYFII